MQTQIILTEDGSHTLFVPELNEHYHSIHGAIQESLHVFISAALSLNSKQNIKIFEVGFGTGLNALLSLQSTEKRSISVEYHGIEFYPLSPEKIKQLNYGSFFPYEYLKKFELIHNCEWNKITAIENHFKLLKINEDFIHFQPKEKYDLIFFDAFGPDKQPEMWTEALMQKLYNCLNINGILTTYSAKGEVKRNLKKAGFSIELIPGPPGKREMIRATKKID
jgi:tRNA U34 5-methylaminomethyl-2-thiouridine-forming methyltransferase MnmC